MAALLTVASALGVTVLHSLWQGALIALVVRAAKPALASATPAQRARLYGAFLSALPVCSLATLLAVLSAPASPTPALGVARVPWLGLVWVAGTACMLSRAGVQWAGAHALRRRAVAAATGAHETLARLAREMGVEAPHLFESAEVECPTLVGFVRPVLLVPIGFMTGLAPRDVELVLRHELAHVARLDPIFNALQVLVEAAYFFHPAAWWLSAQLREARESACDELAVESSADRLALARALTELEAARQRSTVTLAVTGGPLMKRIQSLVHPARPPFKPISLAAPLLALTLGGAIVFAACDSTPTIEYSPRAEPFVDAIEAASDRHDVPAALIAAIIETESNFNPDAESPLGARGLMQLMPQTASLVGVVDVWDPHQNIDGGTTYLRLMLDRYDGDLTLATAAYNAGPNAVDKAGGIPDNGETPAYVAKVLERYEAIGG